MGPNDPCDCTDRYEEEALKRGWPELDQNQRWAMREAGKMHNQLAAIEDMVRELHTTVYDREKGVLARQEQGLSKIRWTLYLVGAIATAITFVLGAIHGIITISKWVQGP